MGNYTMNCDSLLEKAAAGIAAKRARVAKRQAEEATDVDELAVVQARVVKRLVEIDQLQRKISVLANLNAADDKVANSIKSRKRQRGEDAAKDIAMAAVLAENCTASTMTKNTVGIFDYGQSIVEFTK